jgi:hypothetical protein
MDALHEDLNRYTKYSQPLANGAIEEPISTSVAASASKAWRKLLGQNGKRVVTLHVAPITPPTPAIAALDEIDPIKTHSLTVNTVGSDSVLVTESINPVIPGPLSLEVQGKAAWGQHLVRNRSCIVDLFQGQLCSIVKCKECGNSSRTFDPFTSLSLPLPAQHDITVIVTVIRKMPRLSQVALSLALTNEGSPIGAVEKVIEAQQSAYEPIRLVVVLPRLADFSDLRKAICTLIAPPTKPSLSGPALKDDELAPEHLTLLDCYEEGGLVRNILDDRDSVLQLIDLISKSATAAFASGPRASFQKVYICL